MKPWFGCQHYHQQCPSQCPSHRRGCSARSSCGSCGCAGTTRCGCSNNNEMSLCTCNDDYFDDNDDRISDNVSDESQRITETSQTPSKYNTNQYTETENESRTKKQPKKKCVTCADVKYYSSSSCSIRNLGGCCNSPLPSVLRQKSCTKETCVQFPSDIQNNQGVQKYTFNFKLSSPSKNGECGQNDDNDDGLSARLVITRKENKFSAHLTIMGEEVDVEDDDNDDDGKKSKKTDDEKDDLSRFTTGGDLDGKGGSDSSDSNIDEVVYDPLVKDRRHAEDRHYTQSEQKEMERKELEKKESEKKHQKPTKSIKGGKQPTSDQKVAHKKDHKSGPKEEEDLHVKSITSKESKKTKSDSSANKPKSNPTSDSIKEDKEDDELSSIIGSDIDETCGTEEVPKEKSTTSSIKKEPDVVLSACFDEIDLIKTPSNVQKEESEDRLENLIKLYEKTRKPSQHTTTMPVITTPATTSTTKGNNLLGKFLFNKNVEKQNDKSKKDDDNSNISSGIIPINYTVDTPVMQFSRVTSERKSINDETHPLYQGRSLSPPTLSRMQRAVYALPKGQMRRFAEYPQNKSTVLSHAPGESKSKNK